MEAERKHILDLAHFPHFCRAFFPSLKQISNEELIEVGKEFDAWIAETKQGKIEESNFKAITDISPATVITKMVQSPLLYQNGYHGAFILWFLDFVEKKQQENNNTNPNE